MFYIFWVNFLCELITALLLDSKHITYPCILVQESEPFDFIGYGFNSYPEQNNYTGAVFFKTVIVGYLKFREKLLQIICSFMDKLWVPIRD